MYINLSYIWDSFNQVQSTYPAKNNSLFIYTFKNIIHFSGVELGITEKYTFISSNYFLCVHSCPTI